MYYLVESIGSKVNKTVNVKQENYECKDDLSFCMKCPTKLNKNLRSFHKDEHEDVNNIKTNMKRGSKRPATAALSCLCRRFAYDKKNVRIINKDIRNFAEITNEQSMRIMMITSKECINDSLGEA